jgi:nucleoside-diphosphate-sugar epimerase
MSLSGTYLVTGGAGFIGSHIAAALTASGARVRVLDDLSTGHTENLEEIGGDVEFVKGGLTEPDALERALRGVEVVFHEAAIPSVPRSVEEPETTHRASVEGTFALLVAARRAGVRRVVYAASSSAYGDQETLPKTEEMRPEPLSPYAAAKLVGEYYCQVWSRVYGFETACLRYFNVFGPRQDPSSQYSGVISRFISALASGGRPVIYGDGEQSRDFTYIDNCVSANLLACTAPATKASGKVFNVACGERFTVNETFRILKELTGYKGDPAYTETRAGDVKHSLADISAARKALGYDPKVDFKEGLQRTVDWYRKQSKAAKA